MKDISYCWNCGRKIDKKKILKLYDKPFTTIEDLSEIAVATFYNGNIKTLNVFVPYVFDEKSSEKLMLCKTDIENMTEDFSCEN